MPGYQLFLAALPLLPDSFTATELFAVMSKRDRSEAMQLCSADLLQIVVKAISDEELTAKFDAKRRIDVLHKSKRVAKD